MKFLFGDRRYDSFDSQQTLLGLFLKMAASKILDELDKGEIPIIASESLNKVQELLEFGNPLKFL